MNKRKIENPEAIILSIQNALSETAAARFYHWLHLVMFAVNGMPVKQIVDLYNESITTTEYRTKHVVEQGVDSLRESKKAVRLITEHVLMPEVEFLFLPPYSPDFNPIARVWRMTRYKRTHNRYFAKLAILKDTLCSYFTKFRRPNKTMKQLCLNYN